MDKTRAKIKKKRNTSRAMMERTKLNQERDEFKKTLKENGIDIKVRSKAFEHCYRRTKKMIAKTAVAYAFFTVAYTLSNEYGFAEKRLTKYLISGKQYLDAVGAMERTREEMNNELIEETGCDIAEYFESYKFKEGSAPKTETEALLSDATNYLYMSLVFAIYPLYFRYGWKKKKLGSFMVKMIDNLKKIEQDPNAAIEYMYNRGINFREMTKMR